MQARARRHWYRWAVGALGVAVAGALFWTLRPTARTTPPRPAPAIAVLLFQHDANPQSEPLALGLTSQLIAALGSVAGVDVRSLAAVLPYSSGQVTPDSIGRRLNVRWLVGGRVTKRADSVIVLAELTETASGRRIAGLEQRAASSDDVMVTERLVPAVAAMLRERIGDAVRLEGWRAGTRSETAFEGVNRAHKATLDADYLAERGDLPGAWASLRRADSALVTAARADRGWVEPLIQRGWVARKTAFVLFGNDGARDSVVAVLRRGVEQAEAARRLRPNEPRALEVHGVLLHAQWLLAPPPGSPGGESINADSLMAEAEALLTAATRADPTLPRALNILGSIHFRRGNLEQARLALERAYAADAYGEDAQQVLGNLFAYTFADGDDAQAQRVCRAYHETFPRDWLGGFCRLELMAWDSTARPNADSAWRIARTAAAAAEEPVRAAAAAQLEVLVASVLARLGSVDSARHVLDAVHARVHSDPTVPVEPYRRELLHHEAGARVLLGEPQEAIRLLTDYLRDRPERRLSLARDRRFRSLPLSELVDAQGRSR
jgi:TolB-like protein/tetratricopeptide (TPR) repeat protein